MVKGGMHGEGGHAWQRGACMVAGGHAWLLGGVHGCRGVHGEGGMSGEGGVCGEGGPCMVKGGMHGIR